MTSKRRKDPFARVPLWWAQAATKATRTPKALVCIHLIYAQWKAKRATFPLPSVAMKRAGVHPQTRRRTLRQLEAAGLITLEQRRGRPPLVTFVAL